MSPGSPHRVVEIKVLDATDISGWLYEVPGPAPAIIMSHGVCCSMLINSSLCKSYPIGR
jgi:hypothetical protein